MSNSNTTEFDLGLLIWGRYGRIISVKVILKTLFSLDFFIGMTSLNVAKHREIDTFNKIIHFALIVFVLLAWASGDWADDDKMTNGVGYIFHSWCGIAASLFVALRIISGLLGDIEGRFVNWVPYTRDRLFLVREDLKNLMSFKLPERPPRQGLAGVVESFGLLSLLLLAITGAFLFFYLQPGHKTQGILHFSKEIHEAGEFLLPLFFSLHVGAVVLHSVSGNHLWKKMIFIK